MKQKQLSKGNKYQEGRRPRYDHIPVSYAHLLPILVKAGAIMPKQTEPTKLPYGRKHDPHSTCGYHAGYVGHSTEVCHALKTKVQELIDQNLLCFTPETAKHPNQGHPPRMLLAYPEASSSTPVAPQYAQDRAPYVTFGIHHDRTSH
ncbi:hypothetical protein KIW84_057183 [Lathyrus oleraceus]|uniref:Uncharacterized protein n=1 Tax=Pisum sativum TaxID=3888 RepID=A0A9D4X2H2_PEA|nr:hypothetical protein KIW84_057183 [Pisum sativum]